MKSFGIKATVSASLLLLCGMLTTPYTLVAAPTPSVSAPASVGSNETFEVAVSGPDKPGDMLRFADSKGKVLGGSYAYVGNAKNGTLHLTAPFEPGTYQILYLSSREVIASVALAVNPVAATVNTPASVEANATIKVTFTGPENAGDYLQFVDAAGKPVRGKYQYVGNARSGELSLRAPLEAGSYTVAYFTGKVIIGSAAITVGAVHAVLEAPAEVAAGAHFPVEWEGPNNSGDRLRLLTTDGSSAGSYAYVGNLAGGPASLRAPEKTGPYRIVYLTADKVIGEVSIRVYDVSATLTAANETEGHLRFPVTWEGPGNYGDNIQLAIPGTADEVAYRYVEPGQDNTVTIVAPDIPGNYELRYITHGGRLLATRPITITPPRLNPGTLQVLASQRPRLNSGDAVEVVLDASGSMLQQQNGERRIDIAKRTIVHLLGQTIPEDTPFALRVFGHKEADKCRTDLEIPLAPLKRSAASAAVGGVTAMNLARTPIAKSLALTETDLRGVGGMRIIVLVTDGQETCDGDPASAIAALRASNEHVRVSIIGYAIDNTALEDAFTRWAHLGGGAYFPAGGEKELGIALVKSVSPSFTVIDGTGRQVASGIAGGDFLTLAPASYRVVSGDQTHAVDILADQLATVDLH